MMKKKPFSSSLEKHTLAKDYLVLGTTGEGSFGQVKVALHRVTNTMVAIKILERDLGMDYMISSEINLLKSLHYPHVIQLLQVIKTRHVTYLVMEYASQGPLKKTVTKCGHLKEEEARTLFRELTSAIKYIHSRNIAHRDIKPDNILVDWKGHVKLSDFRLGRRLVPGEKVRGFWGTRDYCAPEVFGQTDYEGLPPDIWSLGVVLYFLVWIPPFQGDRVLQHTAGDHFPKLLYPASPLPRASRPTELLNDGRPHKEAPLSGKSWHTRGCAMMKIY
ncbi:LOW QUALITY PROTEIN: sperm motility kinase-like [Psammomys obesus]|uniref:LOW QUALITY PROTEIN: sperm motility kinase-like n=1 Tax=Psammomys obesus TaxID=48139 RepID=UPI002452F7B9|nr:LOW QUALITY PROTEIN: sperm motility kinase-like [Psammomys obesus]